MKSSIFIPEKINVGFQKRSDTYTKKLAYVIYFDETGKLRKEASWNSWRNSEIDNVIHENKPTSGFVLNKKAGGYSTGWNHRQTYVRVYDPRDFEFEISVANLLYILENTNSIKGKGLEGEFVYGWDGTELLLMPVDAPDYMEIKKYNEIIHENKHVKGKELKVGATYITKDNDKLVFLGKFDEYDYNSCKKKGKSFYFYDTGHPERCEKQRYCYGDGIVIKRTLGKNIISVESEECVENYADLMDILESNYHYSPIDESKTTWVAYPYEEFFKAIDENYWKHGEFYSEGDHERLTVEKKNEMFDVIRKEREQGYWGMRNRYKTLFQGTLEEVYQYLKPVKKRIHLKNGKFHEEKK